MSGRICQKQDKSSGQTLLSSCPYSKLPWVIISAFCGQACSTHHRFLNHTGEVSTVSPAHSVNAPVKMKNTGNKIKQIKPPSHLCSYCSLLLQMNNFKVSQPVLRSPVCQLTCLSHLEEPVCSSLSTSTGDSSLLHFTLLFLLFPLSTSLASLQAPV